MVRGRHRGSARGQGRGGQTARTDATSGEAGGVARMQRASTQASMATRRAPLEWKPATPPSLKPPVSYPSSSRAEIVSQYLDENKQLILAILDNQNNGKVEECERHQAKLQHNLMYLAAIADSQPPQTAPLSQYPSNLMMQPGPRYMPPQSGQMMSPQSLMAARSSMMYAHPSMSPLQQQQAAHGQLGMASGGGGGTTSGFSILHGEASMGGAAGAGAGNSMMNAGMFSGFGRSGSGAKEGSTSLSVDVRGGTSSGAQSGDGEYLKAGTEEEGS